jgi:hypothetical protein
LAKLAKTNRRRAGKRKIKPFQSGPKGLKRKITQRRKQERRKQREELQRNKGKRKDYKEESKGKGYKG